MRLRRTLHPIRKFSGGARAENRAGGHSSIKLLRSEFSRVCFSGFAAGPARRIARDSWENLVTARGGNDRLGWWAEEDERTLLPKWYWTMAPLDEVAEL
jgi:hypothetical protein